MLASDAPALSTAIVSASTASSIAVSPNLLAKLASAPFCSNMVTTAACPFLATSGRLQYTDYSEDVVLVS
jgi:hypothetical protein